jgi:hypothetical protein
MEQSGQWSMGTGKENPRPPLCDGRQPRFARLVRGSSRRIMIVKASFARSSNIRVINRRDSSSTTVPSARSQQEG